MPKGIPKNQKLVDEMLYRLCKLELREKDSRDSQDKRIQALEADAIVYRHIIDEHQGIINSLQRRIAEMNEAFSRSTFPRAPIPTLHDAVQ